jgi:anti-sigma regulatory factor (Ser/Thr protein kinase)
MRFLKRLNKSISFLLKRSDIESDLENELKMARHVQDGLLPHSFPTMTNLKLASAYIPTGIVGGDLYDVIVTPQKKTALLIFDVSGHGVSAALIGVIAKMLFNQYIKTSESPAEICASVNRHICPLITTGHYLTAFLAIFDFHENILTYARAGHVPPVLYRKETGAISFLGGHTGNFIGQAALVDIARFVDTRIPFTWNDMLLMYTDGVTDTVDMHGEFFGSDRLLASVARSCGRVDACVDTLVNDLHTFRQNQALRDDITILGVSVGCDEATLIESGFTDIERPFVMVMHSREEIEAVCSTILAEIDAFGYPDKVIWKSKFCICEILLNAFIHGNKNDSHKKVTVLYTVDIVRFAISVIDEGMGFAHHALPDPHLQENLYKEQGRGLFIVRRYMDEIGFNEKGNRIKVVHFRKERHHDADTG